MSSASASRLERDIAGRHLVRLQNDRWVLSITDNEEPDEDRVLHIVHLWSKYDFNGARIVENVRFQTRTYSSCKRFARKGSKTFIKIIKLQIYHSNILSMNVPIVGHKRLQTKSLNSINSVKYYY